MCHCSTLLAGSHLLPLVADSKNQNEIYILIVPVVPDWSWWKTDSMLIHNNISCNSRLRRLTATTSDIFSWQVPHWKTTFEFWISLSTRDIPSLPWWHLLLGGSRPTQALAQVPRDQDVLGQTEEPAGAEGRLGRGKHCGTGARLGGHHQPNAEEAAQ